jgi:hypothetical protein
MVVLALMLGGLTAAGPLAAATVTCGTASGLAGQSVTVALTASDLTGLNIRSYEFDILYNSGVVTATGVTTASTLTGSAGWGTPTIAVTSGRIRIAGGGANALTGAGTLLNVTFLIDPSLLNGSGTSLTLANFMFNEGTPTASVVGGSITVNPTPQIFVSPNTAEIARGQTLQFNLSGSVVNPVVWSTTDNLIASINSSGLLTGNAPGAVRVNAADNGGHTDQSDGDILIRVSAVTVGTASAFLGQAVSIPVTTTTLTGGGVRSGELQITYNNNYLTLTSVTRQAGTLLNGYGSMVYGTVDAGANTTVTVDFAGTTDLAGSGTLFYLNFTASSVNAAFVGLSLGTALFNETLPALRANGSVNVTSPNAFTVNPYSVTLLAGQTQQFTTSGSPVLPLTWSTLNTSVATINPSTGLLTAIGGGVTKVKAIDNVGGVALNNDVTVYDFALSIGTVTANSGSTAHIPLNVDRSLTPLNIRAVEYRFNWSPAYVTSAIPTRSGLLVSWAAPTFNQGTNSVLMAAASGTPLAGGGVLEYVDVTTDPSTPSGTDIPLSLSSVMFNEGLPIPFLTNGLLRVRNTAGVESGEGASFAFAPPLPNPAMTSARFAFTLPAAAQAGSNVRLTLFGTDGRRVRTLIDGPLGAGQHQVSWDTRGEDGAPVAVGIYFARLEWAGSRLDRKVAVVR